MSLHPETTHQRQRRLIGELFTDCEHVPSRVVCSDCHHGPEDGGIAHGRAGEGDECVWPCGHEVRPGEHRCLACEPFTDTERFELGQRPF